MWVFFFLFFWVGTIKNIASVCMGGGVCEWEQVVGYVQCYCDCGCGLAKEGSHVGGCGTHVWGVGERRELGR